MRDLVADPSFLLRKKIEGKFSKMYPNKWLPLYSQVTFSNIPYSVAYEQGKKQRGIMDQIMAQPDIETNWDSPEVMQEILNECSTFNFQT
jgi:kynurenine 3-monooxygenase